MGLTLGSIDMCVETEREREREREGIYIDIHISICIYIHTVISTQKPLPYITPV